MISLQQRTLPLRMHVHTSYCWPRGRAPPHRYVRQWEGPAIHLDRATFDCSAATYRHFWHAHKLRAALISRLEIAHGFVAPKSPQATLAPLNEAFVVRWSGGRVTRCPCPAWPRRWPHPCSCASASQAIIIMDRNSCERPNAHANATKGAPRQPKYHHPTPCVPRPTPMRFHAHTMCTRTCRHTHTPMHAPWDTATQVPLWAWGQVS